MHRIHRYRFLLIQKVQEKGGFPLIRYGRRSPVRKALSRVSHSLCPPQMYLDSLVETVSHNPLGCMMCVYDEQETVVDAIKTTQGIVDFYVVVDKNGDTIAAIEDSDLDIEAEYHVKPELTLAESRDYALERLSKASWILIQDGDEFFDSQLYRIPRDSPNTYWRSLKHIIYPNKTMPLYHSGFHNFLFHNNGTIRIPYPNDIPRMTGRGVHLNKVMIWNYHKQKRPKPQTIHYKYEKHGYLPPPLEAIL